MALPGARQFHFMRRHLGHYFKARFAHSRRLVAELHQIDTPEQARAILQPLVDEKLTKLPAHNFENVCEFEGKKLMAN